MCLCLKSERVGLCKSCVDKYKLKYMKHGFDEATATRMALKLLKRVRRRQRYEILKGIKNRLQSWLFRWCFLTQWQATFLASFRTLSIMWIGRGFNPDYTQTCTGTCLTEYCPNYGGYCAVIGDCAMVNPPCGMNTCTCKAPLANSHQVSNSCTCQAVGTKCAVCNIYSTCTTRTFVCPCGGTCAFDCDTGYSWNGSQCVASAARKSMLGDGSSMIVNNA